MFSVTLLARSFSLKSVSVARKGFASTISSRRMSNMATGAADVVADPYSTFLSVVAKADPPKSLKTLLKLVELEGEELVDPRCAREGQNPFLVPISKKKGSDSLLCYLRWPTQKEDMELQLVRTTESGVRLLSLSTDNYCRRLAAEMDFRGHPQAQEAISMVNADVADADPSRAYQVGDYLPFLKSGKFPAVSELDQRLVLDRFILTKVGPFPDCYERLANNFMAAGNEVSSFHPHSATHTTTR